MGLGLIGGALGGALEGGGKAGVAAIHTAQEQYGKEQLQAEEHNFQRALEGMRQGGADRRLDKTEAGADRRQTSSQDFQTNMETNVRQPFQRDLQQQGFTHAENLQAAQQAFQAEQNAQQRDLTREQIAASKAIAAGNNNIALQVAKLGGSVQSDKDGNVLYLDKEGNAKPVMDPNNPGQPLKGNKDLTPAAKAYADVIKGQLADLDKMEIAAMGDPGQTSKITDRRAALNGQLLNVLTGGIGAATSASAPYKDGTELKGKDGKMYVVQGGAPVLKESKPAASPAPAAPAARNPGSNGLAAGNIDPMQAQFDMEQREMDAGKRAQFSQEVQAWASKSKKLGSGLTPESELERAQAESRARSGR